MAEADMARITLEASGVPCFIAADDCGGMQPILALAAGVRLMVRKADEAHADDVLRASQLPED